MSTTTVLRDVPAADVPPRLGADSNGMSMTPEEFDAVEDYDPEYRYELIRGVVVVNPIPNEAHEAPGDELGRLLRNFMYGHPSGG